MGSRTIIIFFALISVFVLSGLINAQETSIVLPTNDNTSSFNVKKNNGTTVLKVDGSPASSDISTKNFEMKNINSSQEQTRDNEINSLKNKLEALKKRLDRLLENSGNK